MSATIPTSILSAIRTGYNTSLSRTCTVSTPGSPTTDDYGNTTNTPTTVANVKCSFMAAAGNERLIGGALAQVGNYILSFETGVVLGANVTVTVNASGSEGSRTFQLVAPLDEPQQFGQRWLATEG